jgi:hypothetical protein
MSRAQARVAYRLRERDELPVAELHSCRELLGVDRPPEYRREPFRRAEQLDVLADEAGIDRRIQAALFGRDILHTLAMSFRRAVIRRASR